MAAVIAQYPLPVLTAIGHDQDHHVCDMVAHSYLKTPTALADEILSIYEDEDARLSSFMNRVKMAAYGRISLAESALEVLRARIKGGFSVKISAMEAAMQLLRTRISSADPRKILERGYALALGADGTVLKGAAGMERGDAMAVLFKDGRLDCTVDAVTLQGEAAKV
jgi:exodeoxyribonuclease VII large subunit